MKRIVALMILGTLFLLSDSGWARRESLTNEQKAQMERIDRVLIEVLALSDRIAVMYRGKFSTVMPSAEASEDVLGEYMIGTKKGDAA